jgi:hypothetical protein
VEEKDHWKVNSGRRKGKRGKRGKEEDANARDSLGNTNTLRPTILLHFLHLRPRTGDIPVSDSRTVNEV